MFGFFKRKQPALPIANAVASLPFFFKDAQAAFEYCCQYMECPLSQGSCLPALVLDARKEFGTAAAVKIESNGNQVALLLVASNDGGFKVAASTAGPKGPILEPGQLVAWRAGGYAPKIARLAKEKRFGWVGLIEGTLKPEFVNGGWVGGQKFSP